MASEFDRLMSRADDTLFRVFGEKGCSTYTAPGGMSRSVDVDVMLSKNVQVAGADGIFRAVQNLAELRLCQVPRPSRGGVLSLSDGRFLLDEKLDSDGLVERWALTPWG
ncbi:head-tail joining protein [Metapseudomonas resinovorans]|uniref:head-tail joining protein n=1 Tax=Metapseudomonas resinovorans TaxID=53412 RepID=UPI000406D5FA|nr:hypothetical protein [Pseudomonas resinovorans]